MAFDIERFVALSKAVETSDLDWEYIARVGVTDDEARMLRYMADVESHTMLYLRDLLAGHTSRDYEVVAFLSCWVYEETHHGYALDRFLSACGRAPDKGPSGATSGTTTAPPAARKRATSAPPAATNRATSERRRRSSFSTELGAFLMIAPRTCGLTRSILIGASND